MMQLLREAGFSQVTKIPTGIPAYSRCTTRSAPCTGTKSSTQHSSKLELDGRDGLLGNIYNEGFTADFDRQ